MRAIGCCDWRTSANPLFARFKILKLHDIYSLEVAKFVKQTLLGRLPPYFLDYYHKFINIHSHSTRSTIHHNLALPLYSTARAQNSIKFQGAKIWNNIPSGVRRLFQWGGFSDVTSWWRKFQWRHSYYNAIMKKTIQLFHSHFCLILCALFRSEKVSQKLKLSIRG